MSEKRNLEAADITKIKMIKDPQISPEGRWVIFALETIDESKNRSGSHLWLLDVGSGSIKQFTHAEGSDTAPRWSPDGRQIAFLRSVNDETHIWLIEFSGGEANRLDNLSEGLFGEPRWSPAGDQLAFTYMPVPVQWTKSAIKERAEHGLSNPPHVITRYFFKAEGLGIIEDDAQVWIHNISTGKSRQLTQSGTGGSISSAGAGGIGADYPSWSPDGKWIAYLANGCTDPDAEPYRVNLWLISSAGGTPVEIELPMGYKRNLAWAPDGKHIAYIGYESIEDPWGPPNDRLWVIPMDPPTGSKARCLTINLDRFVGLGTIGDIGEVNERTQNPIWSGDSKRIFFPVCDHGSNKVYSISIDEEANPVQLTEDGLDVKAFSADRQADIIAMLVSRPQEPGEIFVLSNRDDDGATRLTDLNSELLAAVNLVEPQEFRTNSFDGQEIQGWLMHPPDFDQRMKYPLVLYIHGGPEGQYGYTYFHEFQFLAGKGIVVLYGNPRGSLGSSEAFASAIRGDWGNLDFQDLMALTDYAASLPYIDVRRMAVAGGSYGGHMAVWTITKTDRFCCAIAERGSYNSVSANGSSDFPSMEDGYWSGNTWDRAERLWEQSPLRYAANIHTPLLLIHNEGDLRCPVSQAEELYYALKWLKREVVFLRYPLETNHGMSRSGPPDLRIDRLDRIAKWLCEKFEAGK